MKVGKTTQKATGKPVDNGSETDPPTSITCIVSITFITVVQLRL